MRKEIDNEIKWFRDEFTCKMCGKQDFLKWGLIGDKELDMISIDCKNQLLARSTCDMCLNDLKKKDDLRILERDIAEKISTLPYNDFDPKKTKDKGRLAETMLRLWQAKKNVYIQGVYDSGKTRSCANIFVFLAKSMTAGVYLKASDLIDECTSLAVTQNKDAVNMKLKLLIASNRLIMLDDLGKHKITDAGGEVLYKLLDLIIETNANCKVWITANEHANQIVNKFYDKDVGSAFVSRLHRMEFANVVQDGLKWKIVQLSK
jgi:DNA replication protein DnaC